MKAPYFITGPLGASKTVTTVSIIIGYLNEGRPVATNIDLFPERMKLTKKGKATPIIRLPDEPRSEDIIALGSAYDKDIWGYDETRNGVLALDETSFFLNSREWNKPDRLNFIKILRLIRKRGWNCFFITQDIESIDGQVINALCKTIGWCQTSDDYMSISGNFFQTLIMLPFKFLATIFIRLILRVPKVHMITFFSGKSVSSGNQKGKEFAWGKWLYASYFTGQEFEDGSEILDLPVRDKNGNFQVSYTVKDKEEFSYVPEEAARTNPAFTIVRQSVFRDMRACYTVLPADYLTKWYPDGVPERPLTPEMVQAREKALKRKEKGDQPSLLELPLSFWLTLPLRLSLYAFIKIQAYRSGRTWRDTAIYYRLLKQSR